MNIGSNIQTLLLLLFFSVMSIVLHRLGVFNTHFNLLSAEHGFGHYTNSSSGESSVDYSNEVLTLRCNLVETSGYQYCGVSIKMQEDPANGFDLSRYENVLIDVDYQRPTAGTPIRILLRNYNENYSRAGDAQSLKYNMLQFSPDGITVNNPMSTQSFQVASWWIEERKISYRDAELDISNVSLVEIETASIKEAGDYTITINTLVLQGNLFSEDLLFKVLLALWLMVSIYLVRREHSLLKTASHIDPLTKIFNRRGLNQKLTEYFNNKSLKNTLVMFYIDIDDFKKINDSYGHITGDKLLRKFCKILELELSAAPKIKAAKHHILSRLSGDEFSIIFKQLNDQQITLIANRLLERFNHIITVNGIELKINASIGIARCSADIASPAILMGNADAAMYHSKNSGKNRFTLFDEHVAKQLEFRKNTSLALRQAIELNQFNLEFMPLYASDTLAISGAEVLIRSTAPALKDIGPSIFIPIAEEYGLVRDIDLFVIESTFSHIANIADTIDKHDLFFCINISALELINPSFPQQLRRLLDLYAINPSWIELEITETSLIDVDEYSIALLRELTALGVKLSLDDFGTGYTAFSQLLNYPVDRLKIDMSFVGNLSNQSTGDSRMVDVILAIAESYNLSVVAEGVETQFQLDYLCDKKCDYLQGFFMSKPSTWDEFLAMLKFDAMAPKKPLERA